MILAAVKSDADAFGHAATHAPQPMQAAASIAVVGTLLGNEDRVGILRAAGRRGDESAGLDDPVERAAIDDEILDHRKRARPPRLDVDRVAVLEASHVKLAGRRALHRTVRNAVDHQAARCRKCPRGNRGRTRSASSPRSVKPLVDHVEHLEERHVGR